MWRDEAYLLDMLIAAREARQFSAGLSWRSSSAVRCIRVRLPGRWKTRIIRQKTCRLHPEKPLPYGCMLRTVTV